MFQRSIYMTNFAGKLICRQSTQLFKTNSRHALVFNLSENEKTHETGLCTLRSHHTGSLTFDFSLTQFFKD